MTIAKISPTQLIFWSFLRVEMDHFLQKYGGEKETHFVSNLQ